MFDIVILILTSYKGPRGGHMDGCAKERQAQADLGSGKHKHKHKHKHKQKHKHKNKHEPKHKHKLIWGQEKLLLKENSPEKSCRQQLYNLLR